MVEKKRIAFYSILSSGHLNLCCALGKSILDQHSDKVDIYFICDYEYESKIRNIDDRFKLAKITYENEERRITDLVNDFKKVLSLPPHEAATVFWDILTKDEGMIKIDKAAENKLKQIEPHFLLCDQVFHLPAMRSFEYAFITSASPICFEFDGFPKICSDARIDDVEKIKEFDRQLEQCIAKNLEVLKNYFKERNVELPESVLRIDRPFSKHFTIYSYPAELEYYPESLRKEHKLWQIDGPLSPSRIPKPFELPKEFSELPGKVIYVSLGSAFSAYVEKIQKMVNILDKLPHKFIVSKGPNGDKLKFPSNKFLGRNWINQLEVLQVCDLMISHGGNNTFCECFYFGVLQIICPILGDQITNRTRAIETSYGYGLDLMKYNEDELLSTVEVALNNKEMKAKLKAASERIQKENRLDEMASQVVQYVEKL